MPSPFHQKYSSQNHTVFTKSPTPDEMLSRNRSNSTSSTDSTGVPQSYARRGSSAFDNFSAFKRPTDNPSVDARRASFADSRPPAGMIGTWWNNFTRGTAGSPKPAKEARDTTTLSR